MQKETSKTLTHSAIFNMPGIVLAKVGSKWICEESWAVCEAVIVADCDAIVKIYKINTNII